MNALWTPLLSVAVVFGVVAGSATWWHQRRFIADLKRRLEDTEQSRREMAEHLLAMRKRLEAADDGTPGDLEERRQALERALDLAGPVGEFPWLETLPSTPADADDHHFQPTQPSTQRLDVNLEESAGR